MTQITEPFESEPGSESVGATVERGGSAGGAYAEAPVPAGQRAPSQDRGQRRVDSILDAASELFAEQGVDAVSVNAIAQRAGSSVGSLYHFFPNKDAIVEALAARYCREMVDLNIALLRPEMVTAPLDAVLSGVVEGFAHYHTSNPAYDEVYQAALRSSGGHQSPVFQQVQQSIRATVDEYLSRRMPTMPAEERGYYAMTSVAAVHWLIAEATMRDPAERPGRMRHLKEMLVRYFEPAEREYGVVRGAAVG
ncbi:MAG: TetR/AcrR family transcriptional regulator [Gemmatimonadaceae bacterium]|jgi:AcrR family transcriptional regulator|nr:TetR/AcrR family transcriptional regulator [Gemmatimonadaceae bacterium]